MFAIQTKFDIYQKIYIYKYIDNILYSCVISVTLREVNGNEFVLRKKTGMKDSIKTYGHCTSLNLNNQT